MRVRMIRAFPGMCDAKPLPGIGGEIDLSDDSGGGLVRVGVAEVVEQAEPVAEKRGPGRPRKAQ